MTQSQPAGDSAVRSPVERLRTLVAEPLPDSIQAPRPEWRYHPNLRPLTLLRQLWQARGLVRSLAERDLRVRYKQAVLGFAWALLNPVGLLVAFVFVFHRAAHVSSGGVPYPLFAYSGLLPWSFFSSAIGTGAGSVIADKSLLNKNYFPREVFPLGSVVVAAVDAGLALVAFLALFAIEQYAPAPTTPLVILPLLVMLMLAVGIVFVLSAVVVHVRDARLALPLVLQFGLFVTPIGYSFSAIPSRWRMAYSIVNPMGPVIDTIRRTVLEGSMPQWRYFGVSALIATIALIVGYTVFKRLEPGFVDVA